MVAHYVRDVGVGRSSRLIPTKSLAKNWISVFCEAFAISAGTETKPLHGLRYVWITGMPRAQRCSTDREHQLFCNPLRHNAMQNNPVRGPLKKAGTTNNDFLQVTESQLNTKFACSRSVVLTSSMRTPKVVREQRCDTLMPFHKHSPAPDFVNAYPKSRQRTEVRYVDAVS